MANENRSLLFIPDISGFTRFVTATELSHSQHIIGELLETIIDSDETGLTVSEIEGDAVLFYRYRDVPSLEKVLSQVKKTFTAFHAQLKRIESGRLCECGACSSASGLTLKMVVHVGEIAFIKVKNIEKPHGPEMVVVHRLLKNDIPDNEYVLLTDQSFGKLVDTVLPEGFRWDAPKPQKASYDGIGEIDFSYMSLSALLAEVPEPVYPQHKMSKPIARETIIEAQPGALAALVSNLELRSKWTKGLDKIEFDKNRLNLVGTEHTCIVDQKKLEFETIATDFRKEKRVYGERLKNAPLMKDMIIYYIFEPHEKGTLARAEVHCFPIPVIGWLFAPLFRKQMETNLEKTLASLKEYSEQENKVIDAVSQILIK